MAGKREKPEDIVLKLRQVEVLQGQGQSVSEAVRQIGVTVQTYYRWRKDYGGMSRDQLKRLKELETDGMLHKSRKSLMRAKEIRSPGEGLRAVLSVSDPLRYSPSPCKKSPD